MHDNPNDLFGLVEVTVKQYGNSLLDVVRKKWNDSKGELQRGEKSAPEFIDEIDKFINQFRA